MDTYVSSQIDGAPVLTVTKGSIGCHLRISDGGETPPGIDVWAPNEDADRLRRAAYAFNEIMREPVAQAAE